MRIDVKTVRETAKAVLVESDDGETGLDSKAMATR